MVKRKRLLAGLAVTAALAAVVSGCSANGAVQDGQTDAKQSSLEMIQDRGKIIVGLSATYKPWEYMEGGEIIGFDPSMTELIAADLGVEAELIDTDWTGVIPSFYTKQFDVIISAMTVSEKRAAKVLFTQPYNVAAEVFLTKDPNLKSLDDIDGAQLSATLVDSRPETTAYWESLGHTFPPLVLLPTQNDAILALEAGRSDAAVVSYSAATNWVKDHPNYHFFVTWGPVVQTAIAIRHGEEELCNAINDSLTDLIDSGQIASLHEEWFQLPMQPIPNDTVMYEPCIEK